MTATRGADLVLNNIGSQGTGQFWYDQLPQIMFDGLISQYYSSYATGSAGQQRLDTIMTTGAAEMHTMIDVLAGNSTTATPNFNYAGFNYVTQTPITDTSETQPDGAGGAAYEQYVAYIHTGNATDLSDAERCMNALQSTPANQNPLYETILPFGALAAARMNAEQGTDYDVAKIRQLVLSPPPASSGRAGVRSALQMGRLRSQRPDRKHHRRWRLWLLDELLSLPNGPGPAGPLRRPLRQFHRAMDAQPNQLQPGCSSKADCRPATKPTHPGTTPRATIILTKASRKAITASARRPVAMAPATTRVGSISPTVRAMSACSEALFLPQTSA